MKDTETNEEKKDVEVSESTVEDVTEALKDLTETVTTEESKEDATPEKQDDESEAVIDSNDDPDEPQTVVNETKEVSVVQSDDDPQVTNDTNATNEGEETTSMAHEASVGDTQEPAADLQEDLEDKADEDSAVVDETQLKDHCLVDLRSRG